MSIFSEVKALVDATDVLQTYRSGYVPDDAAFPYASIIDPISNATALAGDGRLLARRRLLQVDLWQTEEDLDLDLLDAVLDAIDGASITSGFGLRATDSVLVDEPDDIIHHAITVSVVRLR